MRSKSVCEMCECAISLGWEDRTGRRRTHCSAWSFHFAVKPAAGPPPSANFSHPDPTTPRPPTLSARPEPSFFHVLDPISRTGLCKDHCVTSDDICLLRHGFVDFRTGNRYTLYCRSHNPLISCARFRGLVRLENTGDCMYLTSFREGEGQRPTFPSEVTVVFLSNPLPLHIRRVSVAPESERMTRSTAGHCRALQ